jgi:hypothetical protein
MQFAENYFLSSLYRLPNLVCPFTFPFQKQLLSSIPEDSLCCQLHFKYKNYKTLQKMPKTVNKNYKQR